MPDGDATDHDGTGEAEGEAATALQIAVDLLRVPIRLRVNIAGRDFQVSRWSPLQQALEILPYAAVALGVFLMYTSEPERSVATQFVYEASALIVVAGLLVAVVQRVARIAVDPERGADAARRFRSWARAALVVVGGATIGSAYAIGSRRVADLLVTTGTAIVAAAGLDGLVVGPVERLYRFAIGGRHVLTFETDFRKEGRPGAEAHRRTLLRMWPLVLAVEPVESSGADHERVPSGGDGGDEGAQGGD